MVEYRFFSWRVEAFYVDIPYCYQRSPEFLQRKRENISLDAPEASAVSQITADEYFDGDEAQLKFQKVISTLPDKQRLVFNMRYFDNMKYEEMSEILGTSVGALKASYHIAVEKIVAKLKDEE